MLNHILVKLEGIQNLHGFMSLDKIIPVDFKSIKGEVHPNCPATLIELKNCKQ